jgi:two-component system chemotaxis response regulator CheY
MPTSLAYQKPLESLDVVLVHENKGTQAMLRSMVSSMQISRIRAYDQAEQALGDMVVDPPTVLLADWSMKPMSGYRMARMIRNKQMEPLCFVPILAVTAMPTLTMVDRAFSIGVSNIIVMPVSPVVLRRRFEWLAMDAREFVLEGDSYVIRGMEEVLEDRVRRTNLGNLLQRQKAMQDALSQRAENAQDMVDKIVNGEVDLDGTPGVPPSGKPDQSKVTWNSWNVN